MRGAAGQGNVCHVVVTQCSHGLNLETAWRSHSRKIEMRLGSQLISALCPAVLITLGEGLTHDVSLSEYEVD